MFGLSRIPKMGNVTCDAFYGSVYDQGSAHGTNDWKTWVRGKNVAMVYIIAIGGAGVGGGGDSAEAGGGGGGGGSGAIATLLIPAFMLPKELFVLAGWGGAINTSNGGRSQVADKPVADSGVAANTILISGSNAATFGGFGSAGVGGGGVAGTAETVATNLLSLYTGMGVWTAIAGQAGAAGGGSASSGGNLAWGAAGIPISGGAGGSGTAGAAGGNITGAGRMPTVSGGAASTVGGNGVTIDGILMSGGAGGGSSGAAGGKGAWGCGGGGGGGNGVGVGGRGGPGGPGCVFIYSW